MTASTIESSAHSGQDKLAPSVLRVRNLSRAFGGVKAVDSIDLDVGYGRIVGLIGPNGAGKTTTINLITGLLTVTEGSVHLDGRDVTTASATSLARRGLARTFQTSRLFKDLTVARNVELARLFRGGERLSFRHRKQIRADVDTLLERVSLTDLRDAPAGMLSYGHQRRLEIARGLALKPTLLLLDEPVAGMNDHEALAIGSLLRELAANGLSVLVVEHDMRFVVDTAEHIYVLDHGSLIAEGEPAKVLTQPHVVEAYLGAGHAQR